MTFTQQLYLDAQLGDGTTYTDGAYVKRVTFSGNQIICEDSATDKEYTASVNFKNVNDAMAWLNRGEYCNYPDFHSNYEDWLVAKAELENFDEITIKESESEDVYILEDNIDDDHIVIEESVDTPMCLNYLRGLMSYSDLAQQVAIVIKNGLNNCDISTADFKRALEIVGNDCFQYL